MWLRIRPIFCQWTLFGYSQTSATSQLSWFLYEPQFTRNGLKFHHKSDTSSTLCRPCCLLYETLGKHTRLLIQNVLHTRSYLTIGFAFALIGVLDLLILILTLDYNVLSKTKQRFYHHSSSYREKEHFPWVGLVFKHYELVSDKTPSVNLHVPPDLWDALFKLPSL